jgi:lysophospholipase L1-like esterase
MMSTSLILTLLGAEAAVRVRQTLKYGSASVIEDVLTIDPKSGLRVLVANFQTSRLSINSLGFRGPEIVSPKPDGTVRIAFLGASVSYCGEVSGNDYTWPHLVAASMKQAFPETKFDYINGGVPGYTVAAMLGSLTYRVAPLQPDIVVIEGGNDFSGEMRDLAVQQGLIREAKMRESSWPSQYSLLWYLVEKNLQIMTAERDFRSNGGGLKIDATKIGAEYRQTLTQLTRAAQKTAKLVVLVTQSIQPRSNQTPDQQTQASASTFFYLPFITPKALIEGVGRYNEIVREVARETGAVLVGSENGIPGDSVHFADTFHLTDTGSRAMAHRVSQALISSAEIRTIVHARH